MDPKAEYAALIVRPNCFEVYRAVWDALLKVSINTGWEPLEQETTILLSAVGRPIKPAR